MQASPGAVEVVKSPTIVSTKPSVSKPGFPPTTMPLLGRSSAAVRRISEGEELAEPGSPIQAKTPFLPNDQAHEARHAETSPV